MRDKRSPAPLSGVKVLDFTQLLPGAYAGMILADFGAQLIKIEPPIGDPMRRVHPPAPDGESARHHVLNRGKRSYAADLKDPAQLARVLQLAEGCDVVLESFRPGVMERLGLGYADLSARNPRLVYASLTGFGTHGDRSSLPSHDLNFLALSGLLSAPEGRIPGVPPIQLGDLAGGSLQAVIGVLMALRVAESTGKGQRVEVSMLDGLVSLLAAAIADASTDSSALPTEGRLGGQFASYGIYRCRDGHLAIAALEAKFWALIVERLDAPELRVEDHLDPAVQEVLRERLEDRLAPLSVDEAVATLGEDACVSPVRPFSSLLDDEDLLQRQALLSHEEGAGPMHTGIQPRLAGYQAARPASAERIGQSTEAIARHGWDALA